MSARSIVALGIGFGARLLARLGIGSADTPVPPTPVPSGGGAIFARPRVNAERLLRLRDEDEIALATIAAFLTLKANQ